MKIIAMVAAAVLVAGCTSTEAADGPGEGTNPASSSAPTTSTPTPSASPSTTDEGTTIDIEFRDGKVTPQGDRVEVRVGEPVTLRITADAVDEVHVHSDPEHSYPVEPGSNFFESFTPSVPGQIAVEAHELGVTIVQLVVRP